MQSEDGPSERDFAGTMSDGTDADGILPTKSSASRSIRRAVRRAYAANATPVANARVDAEMVPAAIVSSIRSREAFFAHRTHLSSRSRAIVNSSSTPETTPPEMAHARDTCATSRASTTTTATTIAAEKDAISETNAFDAFFSKVHMITSRPRTSTRRRTSAPRVFASSTTTTNLVGSFIRGAARAGTV